MKSSIKFKQDAGSRPILIYPQNVKSIVVGDKTFFEAHQFTDDNGSIIHGFFEKIIGGRINLYLYDGDRYFIRKGAEQIGEITKVTRVRSDNMIEILSKGYGVIKLATADCPEFVVPFLEDQYKGDVNYESIVNKYNNCFNEPAVQFERVEIPARISFGVHGSLNHSQLGFANNSGMYAASFDAKITGTGGVFLSLFHSSLGENLRLVLEPGFGKYNAYSNYNANGVTNDLYIRYSFVRAPLVLRYTYKRLFVDIGASNMIIVKQHHTWRQELAADQNVILTSDGPPYKLKNTGTGALAGIGARFEVAGLPLFTSLRFTRIFPGRDQGRPSIRWIDVNVAIQLTKYQ